MNRQHGNQPRIPLSPMADPSLPATSNEAGSPSRKAVLAASAPWLGALLNVLPGLGAGYLYQRRWIAWWITTALGGGWFALGPALASDPDNGLVGSGAVADPVRAWVGLGGLALLSLVSASEAFLAARRARMD